VPAADCAGDRPRSIGWARRRGEHSRVSAKHTRDASAAGCNPAGLLRNWAAVRAALVVPWSNGQTEGHVTRIKAVKRQM